MAKEGIELEIEKLEKEKESLKKDLIKYQQMGNNAKKLTGYPSGETKRAQNYDKQANTQLSQKWKAELDNTLVKIKDIDNLIQTKKKEGTENKNEIKEQKMSKLTKEQILNIVESSEPARMTKRELIESITNRLLTEDMDDDLRRKIESGEHDYSEHINPETVKRMADDIVRAAKENIESRGGVANLEGAQNIMTQGLMGALRKEARHKEELQDLAIKLVSEEYNIPEGVVDFEAEITGHPQMGGREIRKTGLQMKKGEKSKNLPQGKTAEELKPKVTKRRLMNAMIHGAARKGQNLFHNASNELRRIDPTLVQDYSKLMAGNDFMYWALDDETIEREGQSGTHAGQVRVYPHGNPPREGSKPKIEAQGMTFPLLLHELSKGVLELISQWGRESDKETREYVEDQTDNLQSETMDIRLGVKIWEKLLEAMDVDALPYKAQIFTELSSRSENEFNFIVQGLLDDNQEAIEEMKDIVYEVIRQNNEEEVEQAMQQFRDPEPEDTETPEAPEGPEEDDLLKKLLGKGEDEEIDDPRSWSKRQLENARDEALDNEDYKAVAFYQTILDEKFY
jgi:hypothetical protein